MYQPNYFSNRAVTKKYIIECKTKKNVIMTRGRYNNLLYGDIIHYISSGEQ